MHHCTVEYSSGSHCACVVCRSALGPVVVWVIYLSVAARAQPSLAALLEDWREQQAGKGLSTTRHGPVLYTCNRVELTAVLHARCRVA